MQKFEFSSGTIVGEHHIGTDRLFKGQRNQDAFNLMSREEWFPSSENFETINVGVVCDGMGSGARTEFGAEFAAKILPSSIIDALIPDGSSFEDSLNRDFESYLRNLVRLMIPPMKVCNSRNQTQEFQDYFFFTILGFVIAEETLKIFAAGDGIYYINGERRELGPFPGNAPPFFSYRLLEGFNKYDHRIRVIEEIPISDVDNFLIASDGFSDYEKVADICLMSNGEVVPSVERLYSDDSIVGHPEGVQRTLRLVQRQQERRTECGVMQRIGRYLEDDTTIISARRTEQ